VLAARARCVPGCESRVGVACAPFACAPRTRRHRSSALAARRSSTVAAEAPLLRACARQREETNRISERGVTNNYPSPDSFGNGAPGHTQRRIRCLRTQRAPYLSASALSRSRTLKSGSAMARNILLVSSLIFSLIFFPSFSPSRPFPCACSAMARILPQHESPTLPLSPTNHCRLR
jgi:hypothetical protein